MKSHHPPEKPVDQLLIAAKKRIIIYVWIDLYVGL
jgi:hypothetical protein